MKTPFLFFLVVLAIAFSAKAQDKYATQTGRVYFRSIASETIEATSKTAAGFLDSKTGDVGIRLLIKSFKFASALMEEHFNENYMESDKFPKSEFKGKITDVTDVNFQKNGVYKVVIAGDLTIHGVTKPQTANGTIEIKGVQVIAKSMFKITVADYNIEVPSLVSDKIAKTLDVEVELTYDKLPVAK